MRIDRCGYIRSELISSLLVITEKDKLLLGIVKILSGDKIISFSNLVYFVISLSPKFGEISGKRAVRQIAFDTMTSKLPFGIYVDDIIRISTGFDYQNFMNHRKAIDHFEEDWRI